MNTTSEITKQRALLVEDNQIVQKVHTWILEELNFEVDLAGTGREALQLLEVAREKGHSYGIALVDMGLPDMEGVEIVKVIKKCHDSTKVIVVTACVSDKVTNSCREAGSDLILKKPITADILKEHLNTLLDK